MILTLPSRTKTTPRFGLEYGLNTVQNTTETLSIHLTLFTKEISEHKALNPERPRVVFREMI